MMAFFGGRVCHTPTFLPILKMSAIFALSFRFRFTFLSLCSFAPFSCFLVASTVY